MAYFHCLIGGGSSGGGYELTVTCDADFAGSTITCTDGVTTLTQTCPSASPYEVVFAIPNGGEWTISGIISGQTYSTAIDIPDSLELHSVPEGSTVLPIDDIQTWLACAGITDKSYTTLTEVLADSTTLLALMSNNNAVDYLVRSTSWAGDESVKVPTMTSYTTPSGVVGYSSVYSGFPWWWAFDGNISAEHDGMISGTSGYVSYQFTKNVKVNKVSFYNRTGVGGIKDFTVDYYDGTNWQTVYEGTATQESSKVKQEFAFDNNASSNRWRINILNGHGATNAIGFNGCQFTYEGITTDSTAMTDIGANNYCANTLLSDSTWAEAICDSTYFESVLNVKVPVMTGYTTPEGRVITDSELGGDSISWKAFDNNTNTAWESQQGVTQAYCGYIFTSPVAIKKVAILGNDPSSSYTYSPKDFNIEWSDDESAWTTDSTNFTYTVNQGSSALHNFFSPTLNGSRKGWRINAHNTWGANYLTVRTIQFYGRADV